jgi:hypothetical protein
MQMGVPVPHDILVFMEVLNYILASDIANYTIDVLVVALGVHITGRTWISLIGLSTPLRIATTALASLGTLLLRVYLFVLPIKLLIIALGGATCQSLSPVELIRPVLLTFWIREVLAIALISCAIRFFMLQSKCHT